ncbi:MAG: sugar-transfer associated ATP-grasp domain-containing protein [Patescibacteria group bacterium]
MKISNILGLNARSQQFSYKYNKPPAKKIAGSKLATKRALARVGIPVPETYARFLKPGDILKFDWEILPESFALKPNRGLGGEGIIVVKKRALRQTQGKQGKVKAKVKAKDEWVTTQRKRVTVDDLKFHVLDILEGAFSLRNVPDVAYIEEFVGRHKAFRKYSYRGTPDIRVIVFNKVPVMAMLRLPTKQSGGRANLHQGAIAVGIDIATGITTKAYWRGKNIRFKPGTKRKLHGIKIPKWTSVLEMAVNCQVETELGYLGVDIVLHPEKGPMILELNYLPGLQIQLANLAGLKKRLERVEDLRVRDAEHGVKMGKALFASAFADRVRAEEGIKTVKSVERVKIYVKGKKSEFVDARIDTGALRSSIDRGLAERLGLLTEDNIIFKRGYAYRSASGKQPRPVIGLTIRLVGRKIKTSASVANRTKMSTQLLIGRRDLTGFLVDPDENGKG